MAADEGSRGRVYRLHPVQGFGALIAGSLVVFTAAAVGAAVSTTQVMACSLLRAGRAERLD